MKAAFTIIELIVVTAIITLLACLLLPVLQSAKKASMERQAASQISQIGMAINVYMTDYDDHVPFVSSYPHTVSVRLGLEEPDKFGRLSSIATIRDVLEPYGVTRQIWQSPKKNSVGYKDPFPEELNISYQYGVNNPCTGSVSSLENPSETSNLRENISPSGSSETMTHFYRTDGSVKYGTWKESSDAVGRFETKFDCPAQMMAHF